MAMRLIDHSNDCDIIVNPVGTLCDCGFQAQEDRDIRKRRGLRKPAYYCRPHGFKIIVFWNGIGGCRKCVDHLTGLLVERREKRNGLPQG